MQKALFNLITIFLLCLGWIVIGSLESVLSQSFEAKIAIEQQRISAWEEGYLEAKIVNIDSSYQLEKGQLYRVESIHIQDSLSDSYLFLLNRFNNEIYSKQLKNNILDVLQTELLKQNFLHATISVDSLFINKITKKVRMYLKVQQAYPVQVDRLLINGNRSLSISYLTKLSGLRFPTTISDMEKQQAKVRLERSRFFSSVDEGRLVRTDSMIALAYNVLPQNPNRFDMVLGYVPNVNGGGEIVGNVVLDVMNILAEGNQVALNYQRLEAFRTRFQVQLQQQYIADLPIIVGFQFDLYQRDSTFQTRNMRLFSSYELSLHSEIGFTVRSESTGGGLAQNQTVSNGNALFYGFWYKLDFRDDFFVPTKGLFAKIGTEYGTKINQIEDAASVYPKRETKQWFTLASEYYYPLTFRNIVKLDAQAVILLSDFYQDSDLFRFGGSLNFRGYNEEQFGASHTAWINAEYRFLLDKTSYLFGFHTRGWTRTPDLISENGRITGFETWLQSLGLGLAYRTRLGLLTFTYAKSPEDAFDNAKIHFSIKGNL